MNYIIENGEIRKECNMLRWGAWFECAMRHVADTTIGEARISTVFLGLDHRSYYDPDKRPVLFETMIFSKESIPALDESQWRYRTIEEAKRGHRIVCEQVKEFYPDKEPVDAECECGRIPIEHVARYSMMLAGFGFLDDY